MTFRHTLQWQKETPVDSKLSQLKHFISMIGWVVFLGIIRGDVLDPEGGLLANIVECLGVLVGFMRRDFEFA
jgi:hypothetical protein